MNADVFDIWLSLAVTPGSDTFKKLLKNYKISSEVYNADADELISSVGSRSQDYAALCDKSLDESRKVLDLCKSKNIGVLSYFEDKFPNGLKQIDNPPVLLYYRGVLPDFNS